MINNNHTVVKFTTNTNNEKNMWKLSLSLFLSLTPITRVLTHSITRHQILKRAKSYLRVQLRTHHKKKDMLTRLVRRTGGKLGASRALSSEPQVAKLPDIDYDYNELEPFISAEIMELHHSKHHNTYVTTTTTRWKSIWMPKPRLILRRWFRYNLPSTLMVVDMSIIRCSGKWWHLLVRRRIATFGRTRQAIGRWGSFDKFKAEFNAKAAGVQGSYGAGWVTTKLREVLNCNKIQSGSVDGSCSSGNWGARTSLNTKTCVLTTSMHLGSCQYGLREQRCLMMLHLIDWFKKKLKK